MTKKDDRIFEKTHEVPIYFGNLDKLIAELTKIREESLAKGYEDLVVQNEYEYNDEEYYVNGFRKKTKEELAEEETGKKDREEYERQLYEKLKKKFKG